MIRQLSEDVVGRLRTGVALTSLSQCVEELVLNSVDAGASCVAVRVDVQSLTVQVVDNGQGISREHLSLVGDRYTTSKCHTVEDLDDLRYFGYRGEALASICAASSFVEIVTRPVGSMASYSKCFHKGKPLTITKPQESRPGPGTTVTTRNLFYNLPVRRKTLNEGVELEKIRVRVAGLALMWPAVSFSLRDDVTGNVILQTRKCSSVLENFSSIFGAARVKHMREVEAQNQIFKISGYISRENYSRKDLQFVFVNKRLVLQSKVHKMVNDLLGKSVLVRRRGGTMERHAVQEQSPGEGGSPTKLFERYAVYVINIECSLSSYDITFDPAKTLVEFHDWPVVISLLETMLLTFLREENLLLPTEEGQEVREITSSIAASSSSSSPHLRETDDPFADVDDSFDEELHDMLQKKRYTQGISTHNNYISLFSQTVIRPLLPLEEEGFEDMSHSGAKKCRCDGDTDASDGNLRQPGCSTSNISYEHDERPKVQNKLSDKYENLENKKGSCHQSHSTQSLRDVYHVCDDLEWTKSEENENTEITLPVSDRLLARPARHTAQELAFIKSLKTQPSGSDLSLREIHPSQQFAKSSALQRLKARLAGELQSSALSASSRRNENFCENTDSCSRTDMISNQSTNRAHIQCDKDNEMEEGLADIGLPSVLGPRLFRSKSQGAKGSHCFVGDTVHSNPTSEDCNTGMVCGSDDHCISNTSALSTSVGGRWKHGQSKQVTRADDLSSKVDEHSSVAVEREKPSSFGVKHQLVQRSYQCHSHLMNNSITKDVVSSQMCPGQGYRKQYVSLPQKRKGQKATDFEAANRSSTERQKKGHLGTRTSRNSSLASLTFASGQSASQTWKHHASTSLCLGTSESASHPLAVSQSDSHGPSRLLRRTGSRSQASKLAHLMKRGDVPTSGLVERHDSVMNTSAVSKCASHSTFHCMQETSLSASPEGNTNSDCSGDAPVGHSVTSCSGDVSLSVQSKPKEDISSSGQVCSGVSNLCDFVDQSYDLTQVFDNNCEGKLVQGTQGFLTLSSQGFLPQLTEESFLPSKDSAESLSEMVSATQDESPMSTCSTGFDPAASDPVLSDLTAESGTSPSMVIVSSAPCDRGVQTAAYSMNHEIPPAKICHTDHTHDERHERRTFSHCEIDTSADTAFSSWRTAKSKQWDSETCPPLSVNHVITTNEMGSRNKGSPVQHGYVGLPDHFDLSHASCSQSSIANSQCEQTFHVPQKLASGDQPHLLSTDTVLSTGEEDKNLDEASLTSCSEIHCGQRTASCFSPGDSLHSPSEIRFSAVSSADVSLCRKDLEIFQSTFTSPHLTIESSAQNMLVTQSSSQGQTEHLLKECMSRYEEKNIPEVCPLSGEVQENHSLAIRSTLTQSEENFVPEEESIVRDRILNNTPKMHAKRRAVVERTQDLSFHSGKRPKSSAEFTPSCPSAEASNSSLLSLGRQASYDRMESLQETGHGIQSPFRENRTETGVLSSQQADSFSDSVTDSALVASPLVSEQEIGLPGSLPDSVLGNIVLPESEKKMLRIKRDDVQTTPVLQNSVPDACDLVRSAQPGKSDPDIRIFGLQANGGMYTEVVSDSTSQMISPDSIGMNSVTQNAYKLGSLSSFTLCTTEIKEGSLTSFASQSVPATADFIEDYAAACHMRPRAEETCSSVMSYASERNDSAAEESAKEDEECGKEETSREKKTNEVQWIPVTDPSTGSIVYMNSNSGHTLTLAQWNQREMEHMQDLDFSYSPSERQVKGVITPAVQQTCIETLSPGSHELLSSLLYTHVEAEEEEAHSKWREGSRTEADKDHDTTVTDLLTEWENPVFKKPEQILQVSRKKQAGRMAHPLFHPTTLTKSMLGTAKVIGQLDNKFVACLIPEEPHPCSRSSQAERGLVLLFDQHAAHERVRLGQLTADAYEKASNTSDTTGRRIKRCDVKPPRVVVLSEEDVRIMQSFKEEFDRIGVVFEVDQHQRHTVHVHTIPACMAQREANDRKRGKDPLSYEYLELLLSTAGAKQQLPQQIHRLLATHACKGAIKFGDKLAMSTCKELLSSLSSCDLPFQCAHGRPSTVPLISLTELAHTLPDKKEPPKLWRLHKRGPVEDSSAVK